MELRKVTRRMVFTLLSVIALGGMIAGCSTEDCDLQFGKTMAKRSRSRSGEIIKEVTVYVDRNLCRDSACIVTGSFAIKRQAFSPDASIIRYDQNFQMTTTTTVIGRPNDTEVTWEWEEIGYENLMGLKYDFTFSYDMKTTDYNVKGDSVGSSFKPFYFHYKGSTIVELEDR